MYNVNVQIVKVLSVQASAFKKEKNLRIFDLKKKKNIESMI